MFKKKGGFGKKKIQEMTKQTRLHRLYGIPVAPGRRYALARSANQSVASVIVEASSREVLLELGPNLIDVRDKSEIVHAVGKLVAARAIGMAKDYIAAAASRGGGRMIPGAIIRSIGRTGIEVEVSPSGKVSAKVSAKTGSMRRGKKVESPASAEVAAEVSAHKDGKTEIKVGHKSVIKAKDGTVSIFIDKLQIYITAEVVEEMYVNPERVYHQLNGELEEITGAIMEKPADEETVEDQEGEEQEVNSEDENKPKKKKTAKKGPKK